MGRKDVPLGSLLVLSPQFSQKHPSQVTVPLDSLLKTGLRGRGWLRGPRCPDLAERNEIAGMSPRPRAHGAAEAAEGQADREPASTHASSLCQFPQPCYVTSSPLLSKLRNIFPNNTFSKVV